MVQIISSIWSFEISKHILRKQKFIIGLDSFSIQRFIYLALTFYIFGSTWIILVFASTMLKVAKLQYFSLAPFSKSKGSLKSLK